jgi:capsular exopolysaccharide synthesis family protein
MNLKQDFYGAYPQPFNENLHSKNTTFDVLYWLFRLLKYWYLFVIASVIAMGLAYLKNQYWTPTYRTTSTIMIEEGRRGNDLTSGFYTGQSRNITNQIIVYRSFDLLNKAVDQLGVTNEIYEKTRFKQINRYKSASIEIFENYVDAAAYAMEFNIKGLTDSTYQVSYKGDDIRAPFTKTGLYGQALQHSLFFMTVQKTTLFEDNPKYDYQFHFLSKGALQGVYRGSLSCRPLEEGASVMEISVIGKNAERDIDFLNAMNEQYFNDNLNRKNIAAERSIEFINKQLMIIKDSLDASEYKLNAYQARTGLYGEGRTARANSELDELDKKKADLKYRQDYFKFLSDYLNKSTSSETLMTPSMMGIQDMQLSSLISEYNNLIFKQNEYGETSPLWTQNKKQINNVKARLSEMLRTTPNSLAMEERNLNARYALVMNEMATLPERERKLLVHERNFKINDTYYTYLLQRRAESQIQMASNAPDNMLLDKPRVVAVINTNELLSTYMTYLVIGLLIPCIFFLLKEVIFKFTVQTRDEVEFLSGLPIVGTIERSDRNVEIVVCHYPKSGFAESFRNLRSKLEYLAKKESPISVLVTSTEPKDGKTFVASNLASVYQLTKKKVILVDFDLRRPALTKQMGLDGKKGISNYLIGQVSIEDLFYQHPEFGFDVLPAGTVPPNPSELIRSPKTKELLDALTRKYDYIILDTSPFGLVSDASYLGKMVDSILYVVRNEATNKNFFKYTIKEFKEENEGNIGIIYNDVNLKSGQYGTRHYYGKSSYYYRKGAYYHEEKVDNPEK